MARIGKRLKNAYQGIDRDGFLPLEEGLRLIKSKATAKMKDLNANDVEAATKIIEGSARAMGLHVVEG